jgi:hypothetical protein
VGYVSTYELGVGSTNIQNIEMYAGGSRL